MYDAGARKWRSFETWPPKQGDVPRSFFLHADGRLSFEPPVAGERPYDQYVSDPAHPVPYRLRPIEQTEFEDMTGSGLMACVWELHIIDAERRAWIDCVLKKDGSSSSYWERAFVGEF